MEYENLARQIAKLSNQLAELQKEQRSQERRITELQKEWDEAMDALQVFLEQRGD